MKKTLPFLLFFLLFFTFGCVSQPEPTVIFDTPIPIPPSSTATKIPTQFTHTPTLISTITSTPEPAGCRKPPDDYTRIQVNGWMLNQRTFAMLEYAQELYGGEIKLTGYAITQGSYNNSVSASFGTHAGGGAVDISVMRKGTYTVLRDDIPKLIHALRTAGFAAWFRDYGELHENSPHHIHAIAIGDEELSPAALEQLTGEAGYFRGYSGLPVDRYGTPTEDRYSGPIVCQWMVKLGYQDLR